MTRSPRRCRPTAHRWRFVDALVTAVYLDGSLLQLVWSQCPRCGCALELSGRVAVERAGIRDLAAGLWDARGGYVGIPL